MNGVAKNILSKSSDGDCLWIGTTTFATPEEAKLVARVLVVENLVACASVEGPQTSIYHWQGKIEEEQEYKLCLKFLANKQVEVWERVKELHPYTEPQWICESAVHVSETYLNWVKSVSATH